MAQYQGSSLEPLRQSSEAEPQDLTGWALGFISFAAVMLLLLGTFHVMGGLAALFDDDFYEPRPNFGLEMDVTTWGWVHLIGGTVMLIASVGLLWGAFWARMVCIFFAIVSAIFNFYSIPYYPLWSILMIVLSVGVIWALLTNPEYGADS
jgi:hypothetical protein